MHRGEYEQAVADLEQAATLAPHASEIQNHLGLALMGAGRELEAEAAFRRALDLDCDNLAAAENLETIAGSSAGAEGSVAGPVEGIVNDRATVSESKARKKSEASVLHEPLPEKH